MVPTAGRSPQQSGFCLRPCHMEFVVDEVATDTGFSPSTSDSAWQYSPTIATYLSSFEQNIYYPYQEDNRRKLGTFRSQIFFFRKLRVIGRRELLLLLRASKPYQEDIGVLLEILRKTRNAARLCTTIYTFVRNKCEEIKNMRLFHLFGCGECSKGHKGY